MKKLLLFLPCVIAIQLAFAQIAPPDSTLVLAQEGGKLIAANLEGVAPVEELVLEPVAFVPPDNTRELNCSPNAFKDQAYIRLESPRPNDISMEFIDAYGRKVKAIHFITREGIRIYQGGLEAGEYFYNILRGKQYIAYGKFVIL